MNVINLDEKITSLVIAKLIASNISPTEAVTIEATNHDQLVSQFHTYRASHNDVFVAGLGTPIAELEACSLAFTDLMGYVVNTILS
jgi:hypothetical protein